MLQIQVVSNLDLFFDDTHLSRAYKRIMLDAYTLDGDNRLFNFAREIMTREKSKEWVRFLQMVVECLRCLKPIIMLDRNPSIIAVVT